MKNIYALCLILMMVSCNSELTVMGTTSNGSPKTETEIFALNRLSASAGDVVRVAGTNLSKGLSVKIGDELVTVTVTEKGSGFFTMPEIDSSSFAGATFLTKDKKTLQTFALTVDNESSKMPIMDVDPSVVCGDITYRDPTGRIHTGERNCSSSLKQCTSESQMACITNLAFPPISFDKIKDSAKNIRAGVTFANVSGTLNDCEADGDKGCIVVGPTFAAGLTIGLASKVVTGNTVAGIKGNAPLPKAICSSDGQANCTNDGITFNAASTIGASLKILTGQTLGGISGSATAEAHSSCTGNAQTGCVSTSTYPSADLTNLSGGNIKSGVTIAGTAGTYGQMCSTDGEGACLVNGTTYKAAKLSNFAAADVKSGVTIAGILGSATLEGHLDCSANAQTGCVATPSYQSADLTNLVAGNIKNGTAIAGVTGAYPNSTYPFTVSDGYADLDSATFNAKIKASANFGWFDRNGARYSSTGDTDISAANVKNGTDIFGTTGTYGGDCTADGVTGCVTTTRYKSMDTDLSVVSGWDIRRGKTLGGITGRLTLFKNLANLEVFNLTVGTGASSSTSTPDFYDTLDDYDNNSTFPINPPSDFLVNNWSSATDPAATWVRDSASDTGTGTYTGNNLCDSGEACVYKDNVTNLYWSPEWHTLNLSWTTVITRGCTQNLLKI